MRNLNLQHNSTILLLNYCTLSKDENEGAEERLQMSAAIKSMIED